MNSLYIDVYHRKFVFKICFKERTVQTESRIVKEKINFIFLYPVVKPEALFFFRKVGCNCFDLYFGTIIYDFFLERQQTLCSSCDKYKIYTSCSKVFRHFFSDSRACARNKCDHVRFLSRSDNRVHQDILQVYQPPYRRFSDKAVFYNTHSFFLRVYMCLRALTVREAPCRLYCRFLF